jgi:hypothetical protein
VAGKGDAHAIDCKKIIKPIKAGDTIDIKMMADGWVCHIGPVK